MKSKMTRKEKRRLERHFNKSQRKNIVELHNVKYELNKEILENSYNDMLEDS